MANEPHRILDVNGRMTTVYKRPEGAPVVPNRLASVALTQRTTSSKTDLNSYAGDRYLSISAASDTDDIRDKVAAASADEAYLFMVSDSALDDDDRIEINGGASPVLIHLDSLRPAKIDVNEGEVVIKTYSETHLPTITARKTSDVTLIICEGTGADVVIEGDARVTVIPESGAFGTVYVQGDNAAVLDDSQVKHQMLILG